LDGSVFEKEERRYEEEEKHGWKAVEETTVGRIHANWKKWNAKDAKSRESMGMGIVLECWNVVLRLLPLKLTQFC